MNLIYESVHETFQISVGRPVGFTLDFGGNSELSCDKFQSGFNQFNNSTATHIKFERR